MLDENNKKVRTSVTLTDTIVELDREQIAAATAPFFIEVTCRIIKKTFVETIVGFYERHGFKKKMQVTMCMDRGQVA